MRKNGDDYECIKRNAKITDDAMQASWQVLKAGMREKDVAAIICQSFENQDAKAKFHIILASKNGAFPHHQTGKTILKKNDVILMDIGGTMEGYSRDITCMAVISQPPQGYKEIQVIVDQALEAASQAARSSIQACDVDAAARKIVMLAGYGEYFNHRTGHGIGVEIH